MNLVISISDQVADKLRQRANASGQTVELLASMTVEQSVAGPTLEELLAPIQADFARSDMTLEELLANGRVVLG